MRLLCALNIQATRWPINGETINYKQYLSRFTESGLFIAVNVGVLRCDLDGQVDVHDIGCPFSDHELNSSYQKSRTL
jgi:hypothetical protein